MHRDFLLRVCTVSLLLLLLPARGFAQNAEDYWYMMLDGLEGAVPAERAIVQREIDRLKAGQGRNPAATRRLQGDEIVFINKFQGLYWAICAQKHLGRRCSSSASAAAHRDLNAIQETMSLPELESRLKYLEGIERTAKDARARQSKREDLNGFKLTWQAPPSRSKAGFAVPRSFSMSMPGAHAPPAYSAGNIVPWTLNPGGNARAESTL
jgi:hypothetical protein